MQVFIKTLAGKTIPLKVEPSASIQSLKSQLIAEMPCDQQRLIFNGKVIDDNSTLSRNNIQAGATIHLVLRLTGNSQGPKNPKDSKDLTRAIWS